MSATSSSTAFEALPAVIPQPESPRANWAWMRQRPGRWLALGGGSGLSPWAPGTAGTLAAWLAFALLDALLGWVGMTGWSRDAIWGSVFVLGAVVGVAVCTEAARGLNRADPSCVVWDEIWAFWLVLWWVTPVAAAGPFPGWLQQLLAFGLFRLFDAVKRGPVGWADGLYKLRPGEAIGWRQGWGILFDDLVAAACTLAVLAVLVRIAGFWA
ncbi:phosphatidylglycerophosphatase A [Amphibiibacter pelophylacis]|uniref:Phosphatidylglycerophosphatase A n=1 Tax=Amphibiibacter pelophylacis TaxID=1799477 RepID=A0ACC6P135_9BURK